MSKIKEISYRTAANILRGLANGLDSIVRVVRYFTSEIEKKRA